MNKGAIRSSRIVIFYSDSAAEVTGNEVNGDASHRTLTQSCRRIREVSTDADSCDGSTDTEIIGGPLRGGRFRGDWCLSKFRLPVRHLEMQPRLVSEGNVSTSRARIRARGSKHSHSLTRRSLPEGPGASTGRKTKI